MSSPKGPSEADLVTPRPIGSTPDLRIGASTSPTLSPFPHDRVSNGPQTTGVPVHLTTLFRTDLY